MQPYCIYIMIHKTKANILETASSSLCLIILTITPFLFIAQMYTRTQDPPVWRTSINSIFLIISFVAFYFSAKRIVQKLMKYALLTSWALLAITILNEQFEWIRLSEMFNYFPVFSLIFLHLYNRIFYRRAGYSSCTVLK